MRDGSRKCEILTRLCKLGLKVPMHGAILASVFAKMPLPSQFSNIPSFYKPLKFGNSKVGMIPAQGTQRERRLHSRMSGH